MCDIALDEYQYSVIHVHRSPLSNRPAGEDVACCDTRQYLPAATNVNQ